MQRTTLLAIAAFASVALITVALLRGDGSQDRALIADFDRVNPVVEDFGRAYAPARNEVVPDPGRGGRVLRVLFPANPPGGWTDLRLARVNGIPAGVGSIELWARGTPGRRALVTVWEVESRTVPWPTHEMFGREIALDETWTRHEIALKEFALQWTIGGDGRLSPERVASVGLAQVDAGRPSAVFIDELSWLRGAFEPVAAPLPPAWGRFEEAGKRLRGMPRVDPEAAPAQVRQQAACVVRARGVMKDGAEVKAAGLLMDDRTVACNKHFIGALKEPTAAVENRDGARVAGRMLGGLEWSRSDRGSPLASDIAFLDLGSAIDGGRWCHFQSVEATAAPQLVFSIHLDDQGLPRIIAGNAVVQDGMLLCDLAVEQGQSGSPVFDAEGGLVGIIAGRIEGFLIAVPGDVVLKQIQRIREGLHDVDRLNAEFFREQGGSK